MYTSRNGRYIAKDRAQAVKAAMRTLDSYGVQPTPGRVVMELGDIPHRQAGGVSLNGRDAKTYAEEMTRLGYVRRVVASAAFGARWVPAEA